MGGGGCTGLEGGGGGKGQREIFTIVLSLLFPSNQLI